MDPEVMGDFFLYFSLFLPWMSIMYFKKVKEMVTLKNVDIDSNFVLFSSLFSLFLWLEAVVLRTSSLSKYVEGQLLFSTQHPSPLAVGLLSSEHHLDSRFRDLPLTPERRPSTCHPQLQKVNELKREIPFFTIVFKTKEQREAWESY